VTFALKAFRHASEASSSVEGSALNRAKEWDWDWDNANVEKAPRSTVVSGNLIVPGLLEGKVVRIVAVGSNDRQLSNNLDGPSPDPSSELAHGHIASTAQYPL
jgi:hypothetical protein